MRGAEALGLACWLAAASAQASASGMIGYTGRPEPGRPGVLCSSCHLGGANPAVTIEGPAQGAAGSEVGFFLVIRGMGTIGGFAISTDAADAELIPGPGTRAADGELTHKSPFGFEGGKASVEFAVRLPPTPGTLTIFGVGNACNADGTPKGDAPGAARLTVTVTEAITGPTRSEADFIGSTELGCASAPGGAGLSLLGWLLLLRRRRRRRRVRGAAPLALALLCALPAWAAGLRVGSFTGRKTQGVRAQLASALCAQVRCQVGRGAALLQGKVVSAGWRSAVYVTLTAPNGEVLLDRARFPLAGGGLLGPTTLASARGAVLSALGTSQARPEPEPEPEPAPSAADELEPLAAPAPRGASASSGPAATTTVVRAQERPLRGDPEQPLLRVELGTSLSSRRLSFTELQSATLGPYTAAVIVSPRLNAQAFPFAGGGAALARGVGVELGGAFSVGLRSRRGEGGAAYPTRSTRFELGALWRLRPTSADVWVTASAGLRRTAFALGPSAEGALPVGMPGVDYVALKAGLAVEAAAPLIPRLRPWVGFALLPVLSVGELVGPDALGGGGASGLEVSGGAGFTVAAGWELRAAAELTRYALAFAPPSGSPHTAKAAVDQSVAVTFALRYVR